MLRSGVKVSKNKMVIIKEVSKLLQQRCTFELKDNKSKFHKHIYISHTKIHSTKKSWNMINRFFSYKIISPKKQYLIESKMYTRCKMTVTFVKLQYSAAVWTNCFVQILEIFIYFCLRATRTLLSSSVYYIQYIMYTITDYIIYSKLQDSVIILNIYIQKRMFYFFK